MLTIVIPNPCLARIMDIIKVVAAVLLLCCFVLLLLFIIVSLRGACSMLRCGAPVVGRGAVASKSQR